MFICFKGIILWVSLWCLLTLLKYMLLAWFGLVTLEYHISCQYLAWFSVIKNPTDDKKKTNIPKNFM